MSLAACIELLTTFEAAGALDHAQALADAHVGKAGTDIHPHIDHGITKEWDAAAIDVVERARLKAHESARKLPDSQPEEQPKSVKPRKARP